MKSRAFFYRPLRRGRNNSAGRLGGRAGSNDYPFNLVKRDFLRPPIVKLRRARAGMVRHLRGAFKRERRFSGRAKQDKNCRTALENS